jgi:NtrC-family two-component system sensor histidine kinase KinB
MTLRSRVYLTLLPLLVLLAIVGSVGVVLLYRLGGGIGAILQNNYQSVLYMERLGEAVERIDSSFQFALAGQEKRARAEFGPQWKTYHHWLRAEQDNITEPGEDQLVDKLTKATQHYEQQGKAFYELRHSPARQRAYFGRGGLFDTFQEIKGLSGQILRLNQESMESASRRAKRTGTESLIGFALGLAAAVVLAGLLAWHTVRTLLRPIQAIRQAALGISAGNLDQVVPYLDHDELGELAQAFNKMARYLRDYRQSHSAQLLRAQRTSQATIDSFPDPVMVLDSEGAVEMANPAARRLLGVVPRVLGTDSPAVVWQPPEALRQPIAEALRGQRDYLPESFDHAILLNASGREQALLPRILTIRDPYGNLLGAAVLLQDVTRLRLLDQVKSNLVATASHELKTPLTSIRLAVHLLLEEAVGPLTAKQTELLLDVHPEAPARLLETAAEAAQPRAQDKGVELSVEVQPDLPAVSVDAARLGNALGNLLDNALTYTDRGGKVTLSAAAADDHVILAVSDTGIGIPAESLPHVFEKFFRVPGQGRGGGTGLGLAIVHEIIAAHGGTISCESQPNVATTFRITLPLDTGSNHRKPSL